MQVYDGFTISWTRAYSTCIPRDAIAALLDDSDAACLTSLPNAKHVPCDGEFYDVQALDDKHIARLRAEGVALEARLPGDGERLLTADVAVHLLFHAAGFMLVRLTLADTKVAGASPASAHDFQLFYENVWHANSVVWKVAPSGEPEYEIEAGVRTVMDSIFFDCHETTMRRSCNAAAIQGWTSSHQAVQRKLRALRKRGEILSPYPVVFGTHYELVQEGGDLQSTPDWMHLLLLGQDQLPAVADDIDKDLDTSQWYLGENKSVVLLPECSLDSELDAYSTDRMQLIEFLNMRRGALRVVQRETQVAITGGRVVDGSTVAAWNRLLSAFTDDYVLHDRIGQYIGPLNQYVHSAPRLRSLLDLEQQVRRNLEAFHAQMSAAASRAQIVVGILFGIVAATALGPLVRRVLTQFLSVDLTAHEKTLVDLGLIVVLFFLSLFVLRRASRLRPPRAGPRWTKRRPKRP